MYPTDVPAIQPLTDGRFRVGIDLAPGTYEVTVGEHSGCFAARLANFRYTENFFLEVVGDIEEEPLAEGATVRLTVEPTDVGVLSIDCGFWTRVSDGAAVRTSSDGDKRSQSTDVTAVWQQHLEARRATTAGR